MNISIRAQSGIRRKPPGFQQNRVRIQSRSSIFEAFEYCAVDGIKKTYVSSSKGRLFIYYRVLFSTSTFDSNYWQPVFRKARAKSDARKYYQRRRWMLHTKYISNITILQDVYLSMLNRLSVRIQQPITAQKPSLSGFKPTWSTTKHSVWNCQETPDNTKNRPTNRHKQTQESLGM